MGVSIDGFGIGDGIDSLQSLVMDGVGTGDPERQIVAGIVIGGLLIATSAIGLVFTLLLLPIPVVMIAIGALRLIPPVESAWPMT